MKKITLTFFLIFYFSLIIHAQMGAGADTVRYIIETQDGNEYDAKIITDSKSIALYFEELIAQTKTIKELQTGLWVLLKVT